MLKLTRESFIPKDVQPTYYDNVNAVIYFEERNGKFLAKAFSGKRAKPDFYYNFKTEEHRARHVKEYLERLQAAVDHKKEREAMKKAFINPLKVGDILYTSWGYDQTNIDFYQVTELVGKKSVKIRELCTKDVGNEQGHSMSASKVAIKDAFWERGEEMTKRVQSYYDGRPSITISSFETATLWDGTPKNYSWYA